MFTDILAESQLFEGISAGKITLILPCLAAVRRKYEKGGTIIWEGESVNEIGILLSGKAISLKTDANGNQVIVTLLKPGSYIGILLATSRERRSPVTVQVQEAAEAFFIPVRNFLSENYPCRVQILENLLNGISEKALVLHDRNDCLIKPTIRDKVLTFLLEESRKCGADSFKLELGRDDMAEYLDVNRSALSRELSWMKRDGLIDYRKNWFRLLIK